MNFQDPVTAYCYNLIAVHHDVFWFIIVILSVVYWALYKILKEFGWNTFNKQSGFFRYVVYSSTWYLVFEAGLLQVWFKFFIFFFDNFFKPFIKSAIYSFDSRIRTHPKLWTNFSDDFVIFLWHYLFGKEYFEGFVDNSFKLSFEEMSYLVEKKYSSYLLSTYSANAFLFYDRRENFLAIHNFKHSTKLEYIWGIFPTTIIVLILLPSMFLLYSMDDPLDPSFTIKVIGHQWFWSYEFNNVVISANKDDIGLSRLINYNFDSVLIQESDLVKGSNRLLEVDNRVVVPLNKIVRFIITSGDVIHSWALPNLGIKVDAVPGRLNQFISLVCHPGVFYGQCSELCGVAHSFMPIVIQAIPYEKFLEYLHFEEISENMSLKFKKSGLNFLVKNASAEEDRLEDWVSWYRVSKKGLGLVIEFPDISGEFKSEIKVSPTLSYLLEERVNLKKYIERLMEQGFDPKEELKWAMEKFPNKSKKDLTIAINKSLLIKKRTEELWSDIQGVGFSPVAKCDPNIKDIISNMVALEDLYMVSLHGALERINPDLKSLFFHTMLALEKTLEANYSYLLFSDCLMEDLKKKESMKLSES